MSRHTFVLASGQRLEIQPSKINRGSVLLQVVSPGREVLASCEVDPATAAVVGQAFGLEAAAAESLAESVRLAKGLAESVSGARGEPLEVYAPRIDADCDCDASRHVGRFRPPCVCNMVRYERFRDGGPVLSALPVVDVPQVDASEAWGAVGTRPIEGYNKDDLNAKFFARRATDSGAEKVGA